MAIYYLSKVYMNNNRITKKERNVTELQISKNIAGQERSQNRKKAVESSFIVGQLPDKFHKIYPRSGAFRESCAIAMEN